MLFDLKKAIVDPSRIRTNSGLMILIPVLKKGDVIEGYIAGELDKMRWNKMGHLTHIRNLKDRKWVPVNNPKMNLMLIDEVGCCEVLACSI